MATRSLYRRDLSDQSVSTTAHVEGFEVRAPDSADAEALAELMLNAYLGTIDYEGETIVEAREAVAEYLDEEPILECSRVASSDGGLMSAVLACSWSDGAPLIAYAMTEPVHKGHGLAATLLGDVLGLLAGAGHEHVHAGITNGNHASERLFLRAGFVVVDWK